MAATRVLMVLVVAAAAAASSHIAFAARASKAVEMKGSLLVCEICCVLEGKAYRGIDTIPGEVLDRIGQYDLISLDYSCGDDIPGGPSLIIGAAQQEGSLTPAADLNRLDYQPHAPPSLGDGPPSEGGVGDSGITGPPSDIQPQPAAAP